MTNNKIQVDSSHYFKEYDTPLRWLSYKVQGQLAIKYAEGKVLEIGIGNKTVSNYLDAYGLKIITCDFDKSLKPDVVCDIRELPFKSGTFDTILCFEILEHLPFERLGDVFQQLKDISSYSIIISVPHFFGFFGEIQFKIPGTQRKTWQFKIPFPRKQKEGGEHYWELGKKKYPAKKLRQVISNADFNIIEEKILSSESFHRVLFGKSFLIELHHFFVLQK